MPQAEEKYGAPLWVVHRADLQTVLLEAARKAGIVVQTGHHVDVVDFGSGGTTGAYPMKRPRYKVNEGVWQEADVIICADGIKSHTRKEMMKIHGQTDAGAYHTLL
jgi:salicylate hydroxylase